MGSTPSRFRGQVISTKWGCKPEPQKIPSPDLGTSRTPWRAITYLLTKWQAGGNAKAVALITKISPAAWRHILLNGHYTFQSSGKMIDLDTLLTGLELG